MLQNIQTAVTMAAAAAKEAAEATEDLESFIAWADKMAVALAERDKEMLDTMLKASAVIQTDLAEFRKRASALHDRLTGNGKPEEETKHDNFIPLPVISMFSVDMGKPVDDAGAIPPALDRRNTEEANGS